MDEDEAKVELGKSSKGGKSREKVLIIYSLLRFATNLCCVHRCRLSFIMYIRCPIDESINDEERNL